MEEIMLLNIFGNFVNTDFIVRIDSAMLGKDSILIMSSGGNIVITDVTPVQVHEEIKNLINR